MIKKREHDNKKASEYTIILNQINHVILKSFLIQGVRPLNYVVNMVMKLYI